MKTSSKISGSSEIENGKISLTSMWVSLAETIKLFSPDVCVLIARKMPRLLQSLSLTFGDTIIISDLAIPFVHRFLKGARVAIIDDLVNVGSTLSHVRHLVEVCNPSEIQLFALGARRLKDKVVLGVECAIPHELSPAQYYSIVADVPRYLLSIPKPYDLEFPVIPCRLLPPISNGRHLLEWLISEFPNNRVHDLGVNPNDSDLHRITLDMPAEAGYNLKLRLYIDNQKKICNVVSFAIPPILNTLLNSDYSPIEKLIIGNLEDKFSKLPKGLTDKEHDPILRIRLFVRSWEFGTRSLSRLADVLALQNDTALDLSDASLLFGPHNVNVFSDAAEVLLSQNIKQTDSSNDLNMEGPSNLKMIESHMESSFAELVTSRTESLNEKAIFRTIFEVLSTLVGAENPDDYCLKWPFTIKDVKENNFLRLKVGLTFADLVDIMTDILGSNTDLPIHNLVSYLLDSSIDYGEVVPTTAFIEGRYLRIFRKGENKERDLAVRRVLYALQNHGKPLSLTRIAKITAILSYSADFSDSISPSTLERGNVASIRKSSVDLESPVIAEYLRDIGAIKMAN